MTATRSDVQGAPAQGKIAWRGEVLSVQPRIRLFRSFDERYHGYQGYALLVRGEIGGVDGEAWLGLSEATLWKHPIRAGVGASGYAWPVADARIEAVEYYKVSGLRVEPSTQVADPDLAAQPGQSVALELTKALSEPTAPTGPKHGPPWTGIPPTLEVYRARGHRRLASATYAASCWRCVWGAKMAVEITIDQWKPQTKKYRTETFCYGPLACTDYRAGATRKVPGRRGMSYEESDLVDEDSIGHRGPWD